MKRMSTRSLLWRRSWGWWEESDGILDSGWEFRVKVQPLPSLAQHLEACISPVEIRHILKSPAVQVCHMAIGGMGGIICISTNQAQS